jgi:hypothetical protein
VERHLFAHDRRQEKQFFRDLCGAGDVADVSVAA